LKTPSTAQALILANGARPSKKLFVRELRRSQVFVCADGGANSARMFHTTPDLIIGDLDSVTAETLAAFHSVPIKRMKDQNSTDLEKAIKEVIRKRFTRMTVLGATGGRLDHAIGNLSALAKFSGKATIDFLDDTGFFRFVGRSSEFRIPPATTISLIPLSVCTGITTSGLRWNLRNESLQLGIRESTSNSAATASVRITVRHGDLIAYILQPPTSRE
jgi:thiamine pyrophosphokinase